MSLFERLNNKRYNLHEESKDPFKDFNAYDNLDKEEKNKLRQTKNIVKKQIKDEGDKISSEARYPSVTKKINKKLSDTTTSTGKIQRSVDARVITKKFNQNNPNRPEYVKPDEFKAAETKTKQVNPKQTRPLGQLVKKTKPSKTAISGKLTPGQIDFSKAGELAAKRKARIDSKTGKATQAGVFDFAKNRGGFNRMSKGMSKSDFKKMIASDPKKAAQFKNVVKTAKNIAMNPASKAYKDIERKINTSDYAGKISRRGKTAFMNPSQKAAEIARIKAGIDARDAAKGKYKKPKTVLKVTEPGSKFRASKIKGFDVVPTSNPVGKEILKKMDTTGFVPPKPKKLTRFQKMKKVLFDPQRWKIPKKDWDLKPARFDKAGNVIAQRRLSFKRGPIGTLRKINAMLPTRYKVIAGLALAAPTIKKTFFSPKAKPMTYTPYKKPLGFDTGKRNYDKLRYKKDLAKLDPVRFQKEFPKLPKKPPAVKSKPAQYGSYDPKTKKMVQTTNVPKNINKNLP